MPGTLPTTASALSARPVRTEKGEEHAQRIVEAAYRCLANYGYAETSMQRIADEAGTTKRMLLYYFHSRERLLEAVVRTVGERLLGQVREAMAGLERPAGAASPSELAAAGFDRLWDGVCADPQLSAVYFGLFAESVTNPSLKRTLSQVNDGYRELIGRLVAHAEARGRSLRISRESLTIALVACVQGLTLDYLERGDSPALRRAVEDFKLWLMSLVEPETRAKRTSV